MELGPKNWCRFLLCLPLLSVEEQISYLFISSIVSWKPSRFSKRKNLAIP